MFERGFKLGVVAVICSIWLSVERIDVYIAELIILFRRTSTSIWVTLPLQFADLFAGTNTGRFASTWSLSGFFFHSTNGNIIDPYNFRFF